MEFEKDEKSKASQELEIASEPRSFDINELNCSLTYIAKKDYGLIFKYFRYNGAFNNIISGDYKNPYLIYSIFEINQIPLDLIKQNKQKIQNERSLEQFHLNKQQLNALVKAISTRDVFYLQGPPGTGKTQTISAIAQYETIHNHNVLITSSTHEAIENFMDRLNDYNAFNPNLILYKQEAENKQNLKPRQHNFKVENLYPNFVNKIINFINLNNKNNEAIDHKIHEIDLFIKKNNLLELITKNLNLNFHIKRIDDLTIEQIKNNKLFQLDQYWIEHLKKYENDSNAYKSKLKDYIQNQKKEEDENTLNLCSMLDELILLLNQNKFDVANITTYTQMQQLAKNANQNNDVFLKNLQVFQKQYDNKLFQESNQLIFNNFLFNNNLINAIGLTTTAKPEIILDSEHKKSLYTQYPIHMVIIDEISKSCTPEILSRVILANKVIFSGDYKQLPPLLDLDDAIIKQIKKKYKEEFIESIKNNNFDDVNEIVNDSEIDTDIQEEQIDDKLDEEYKQQTSALYKHAFFHNQVNEIKQRNFNREARNYEALKIQHRFNKEIMDLVNLFYDDEEQLEMPEDENDTKKIKPDLSFEFNGVIYKSGVNFIDTTSIETQEFLSSIDDQNLLNKIKQNDSYSFDQSYPCLINKVLYKDCKIKNTGNFNEYNVFVITQLLTSIATLNKQDLINKIGVICLTRNEVNLIKTNIEQNGTLKKLRIKVDTIDSFQGREKDYIIVDFVRAKGFYKNKTLNYYIKDNSERSLKNDFIADNERINVANSRSKKMLILVGAFKWYKDRLSTENKNKLIYKIACYKD